MEKVNDPDRSGNLWAKVNSWLYFMGDKKIWDILRRAMAYYKKITAASL